MDGYQVKPLDDDRRYHIVSKQFFHVAGDIWPFMRVMTQIRRLVDDGHTVDFLHDPWLSDLPLSRWPTLVNVEMGEFLNISDFLHTEESD